MLALKGYFMILYLKNSLITGNVLTHVNQAWTRVTCGILHFNHFPTLKLQTVIY